METTMIEIWLPVPGYDGLYEVSSLGQVRSLPRSRTAGKVLKQRRVKGGYVTVTLSVAGVRERTTVHDLVARSFHGRRPRGLVIRHLDGDPSNNRASNLRYGTESENAQDRIRHGRHNQLNKTNCPQGHPYDEANTSRLGDGSRACRKCRAEAARRCYARKKIAR
jgi:hypothetical protein